jgi:hypothetical protein
MSHNVEAYTYGIRNNIISMQLFFKQGISCIHYENDECDIFQLYSYFIAIEIFLNVGPSETSWG